MSAPSLDADFWVTFNPRHKGCAAAGCRTEPTLIATLSYCWCDEQPEEHGHPGHPEAERERIAVCEKHGALIAHGWKSFERLENETAARR